MRNILKIAPSLNFYKECTTATAPLTITIYLLKKIFIWLDNFQAIGAVTIVEQVVKVSGNNENLWVSDLVELKPFIKLMDIDRDWVIENMYDEMLNYDRIIFFH